MKLSKCILQTNFMGICAVVFTHLPFNVYFLIRLCFIFRFQCNIGELSVLGSPQNGITPKIVLPESEEKEDMLLVWLETNPLDKKCDKRIIVESRPLQIVYDLVRKTNSRLL